MAVSNSSKALRDELRSPTVIARQQVRTGMQAWRPMIGRVTQQMARLQQLLAAAEEDEQNPMVAGKFERLSQTFRAIQRQQLKVEAETQVLSGQLKRFADEAAAVVDVITAEELT